jgi:hypothetical protein
MNDKSKGWLEPESAANRDNPPKYPHNHVTQTDSGHMFEMDDTPDRERIRLAHRSGTFIEMHPNGDEVHKVYGDGYEITIKNKNVLIKGDCNITIDGDTTVHIKGDKKEYVEGNYDILVDGNFSQVVKGESKIISEQMTTLGSQNTLTGRLKLLTGESLHLSGDLHIDGELTADKIFSETRVDAALGMSAGPYGFVTLTGGFACGYPVAVPFQVNASAMVNSPVANFGLMSAILMTDVVNRTIYNMHFHICPDGRTSPPTIPMV